MRTPTLSLLTIAMAGSLTTATPALAAQWNLASPYGDASFHTQNTKQFAEDVTKATDVMPYINRWAKAKLPWWRTFLWRYLDVESGMCVTHGVVAGVRVCSGKCACVGGA